MKKQILISTIFAMVALSSVNAKDIISWTRGKGTFTDPYIIENEANLEYLAQQVSSYGNTYSGIYFRQSTDLQCSTMIGDLSHPFSGNYDGSNHTIQLNSIISMFAYLKNATVTNIRVYMNLNLSTAVSGSEDKIYCGAIAGYINSSEIYNCHLQKMFLVAASATHYIYAGGLIGYSSGTSKIVNCSSDASCKFSSSYQTGLYSIGYGDEYRHPTVYAGGIVGYVSGTLNIDSCVNYKSVSADAVDKTNSYTSNAAAYAYVGGIIGYSYGQIIGSVLANHGDILSTAETPKNGYTYAGGILGYGKISLQQVSSVGNITAKRGEPKISGNAQINAIAGGIIGYAPNSTINFAYSRGTISAIETGSSVNAYAGGLIGTQANCIVSNAYFAGKVSSTNKFGIAPDATTCTNTYYMEGCGVTSGNGTMKDSTYMRSSDFPNNLNKGLSFFVQEIYGVTNDFYPIFGQQKPTLYTISVITKHGRVEGEGQYPIGYIDTLTAIPDANCQFLQWSDGVLDNPRIFKVQGDSVFTALFEKDCQLETIHCTIVSESPYGNISFTGDLLQNSSVTLNAEAPECSKFVRWSDGDLTNPRNVTVTQDSTFTAIFEKIQYKLSIDLNDTEHGDIEAKETNE